MVKSQKVQQKEKRPVCPLQKKAQEYSSVQSMPPRDVVLEEKS